MRWLLVLVMACGAHAMNPDQTALDRVAAITPQTTLAELEATLGSPARDLGSGI